jgi:hypothetical protein
MRWAATRPAVRDDARADVIGRSNMGHAFDSTMTTVTRKPPASATKL